MLQSRRYVSETEEEEEESPDGDDDLDENQEWPTAELPGDCVDDQVLILWEPNAEDTYVQTLAPLWKRILRALPQSQHNVVEMIQEWSASDSRYFRAYNSDRLRSYLRVIIARLRRRSRFLQALQISNWMFHDRRFTVATQDLVMRLYLTSRSGLFEEAEKILAEVHFTQRNEWAYLALLSGYASRRHVTRAEKLWRRMKERGLTKSPHGYNNMLIMYKRKKLHSRLRQLFVEMVLSGVVPDATTFLVILSAREQIGGFQGIEKRARHAMANLEILNLPWFTMEVVMRVYGFLGDLEGGGKDVEESPAEAFSMAGAMGTSEAIFQKTGNETKDSDLQRHYVMIEAYCREGMTGKAQGLLRKLIAKGRSPAPFAFNSIIQCFLKDKQLDRALELFYVSLNRFGTRQTLALGPSILGIMEVYAKAGDVNAAEQIVHKCQECHYFSDVRLYNALLKVYLNSQVPATGIEDRFRDCLMQGDTESLELLRKAF
ncbi:hypothetical protein SELMODRAFT_421992 [Selaginella moellendorffii]|uniref:Pentacotripeptide-repeat region of PRORP domain-containing protein n=1 Tax=Selaginella moellendorffii TaxID=88036 RepID=D8SH01_SELML|nr:hypothetical protein SELMODRAFT_421992 [Selaginella moellendorffii]